MNSEEEEKMAIASKLEHEPLNFMNDMKNIIKKNMKKKGLSSTQARETLGIKRYEKR